MKHNEPSIAPKAHTKKYILALLLACGAASSQCHGFVPMAPVIVALWSTAAGLTAALTLKIYDQATMVEEGQIKYDLISYVFERVVKYPLAGKSYTHRWRLSTDQKGNPTYTYAMYENGARVPGTDSTSVFTLGGPNGMPLTKREYQCETITANARYTVTENSDMDYKISHTVTKSGGPWYTPPVSYNVNFEFDVNKLPGTCGGQTLPGLRKTGSCSVYRNGFSILSYPYVNYEVISGRMIVN